MESIDELKTELARIRAAANDRVTAVENENKGLLERIEELEARGNVAGLRGTPRDGITREQREHTEVFSKWIRDPRNERQKQTLLECESDLEKKDVTTTSPAGGGFGVPTEVERNIERKIPFLNPLRSLVRTVTVGQPSTRFLVDLRGETTGWAGETDTRNATNTPQLRERIPTFGMNYGLPRITEEALNDIAFDSVQWLTDDTADNFASAEALAILSGNGTSRPTGIFNTTPTNVDDEASPLRAKMT
jgi:HK97 family phage major capsid protein